MRALPTSTRLLALVLATLASSAGLASAALAAGPAATRAALQREMRSAGPWSAALAVDLDSGHSLYARRATRSLVPASVNKLNTTAALLRRFGPEATLSTDVLAQTPPFDGVVRGNLYLRGGGDPTFGAAQARRLARALANTGMTHVTGRVIGDESLFDGLRGPPSEGFGISRWVGPLSALAYQRGRDDRGFQARPAIFAAQQFERALRRQGIVVARRARSGVTPAAAAPVMSMPSDPMSVLIARTNTPSDNFMAETLIKLLGARFAGDGTTAAGATVVREALAELGVRPRVVDGSGLSRANRTTASQVVTLLRGMHDTPDGPAFISSLAIAGRTGTLAHRLRWTAADGRCQAKTGTLTGVSALAGYCTSAAGGRVAFAFLMNGVDVTAARRLQDRMTVALATYRPAAVPARRP